ncbi:hypothetical protein BCU68_12925 [Vibrio sp. 10N.286.49.B3]|nr:hypothetical protein BCU68_12925 [Vibrio sp. 10N.286.49.B3]
MTITKIALATSALLLSTPALSAGEMEYNFGGSINTVLLLDSNISGAGVNIPANTLYGKSTHGDNKLDVTLSQVSAGVKRSMHDGSTLSARYVMDFNASNNSNVSPRVREAYLRWDNGVGQVTAGQTWSTLMDLRNLPPSVTEATFSGVAFMRQPLVRWTQSFDTFKYHLALEDGSNADISYSYDPEDKENIDNIDRNKSTIDLIGAIDWDFSDQGHVYLSGLLAEKTMHYNDKEEDTFGYAVQASAVYNLTPGHKFSIIGFQGKGVDRYILGTQDTGATWNDTEKKLELRKTKGAMAAYTRTWSPSVLSVFGVGSASTDPLEFQESSEASDKDTFTYTQYAVANVLWDAYENVTLGLEYNYSYYERLSGKDRENHRVSMGVNWKF